MSRKLTTFKRKETYDQMKSRGTLPVDEASIAEALISPSDSDEPTAEVVEKGIRLLFQHLFMVSLDEMPLSDLKESFRDYAAQVKSLRPEEKVAVVKAIDFFVGRVRQGIEPVLLEWYKALQTK